MGGGRERYYILGTRTNQCVVKHQLSECMEGNKPRKTSDWMISIRKTGN